MNKKYLYIAMAGLLTTMGSCSSDTDALSDTTPEGNIVEERIPIQFGRAAMASLSTRADYDEPDFGHADANISRVGIYGLARDIVGRNEQAQRIEWWNTDEYHNTCCLLRNVQARKTDYDIEWEHGVYYYPVSQFYAYDFFAYYPYCNTPDETVQNRVTADITINGQTDLLWGRATNNFFNYAYSAKYIREHSFEDGAQKGLIKDDKWLPCLHMNHMLSKLIFRFTPGEFAADRDIQIVDISVKDAHDKLTLLVAELDVEKRYTTGWKNSMLLDDNITFDDLTTLPNSVMWKNANATTEVYDETLRNDVLNEHLWVKTLASRATFHLCENVRIPDSVDPTADINPSVPSTYYIDPTEYSTRPKAGKLVEWPQRVGGCIMVYPETCYKVYVTLREKLDYTPDDAFDPVAAGENPKYMTDDDGNLWRMHYTEQPLYVYLNKTTDPAITGEDVFTEYFKPSYNYYVDLTINYPTRVVLKSVIVDWKDAEKNPVSIEL